MEQRKITSVIIISLFVLSSFDTITTQKVSTFDTIENDMLNSKKFSNSLNTLEVIAQSEKPEDNYPIMEPKAPRTGPQHHAVICAKLYDQPTTRWITAEIGGIMDTLNDFWYNVSNEMITITYDVVGWYDLEAGRNWSLFNIDFNANDVFNDAIELADPDLNYALYDCVIVWMNVPTRYLGQSYGSSYRIFTDEGEFNVGGCVVGENPIDGLSDVWGRVAHEIGHNFGLGHTHPGYFSEYSLMALGYPSDLCIYSQLLDGRTGWFDTSLGQQEISPGSTGTFVVSPRHYGIPIGATQSLKVTVSESRYYMIEVVKKRAEDAWDYDEGVYIYFVDESLANPCADIDATPGTASIRDCLFDIGGSYTNATYNITIEVIAAIADGYEISVTNIGTGVPDLKITDWGDPEGITPPYETPDIWVDSSVNGWGYYRHRNGTTPIGIGDEPWANHENRLYARIHNIGATYASDVEVRFYESIPIGAGDLYEWSLINSTERNVSRDDSVEVFVSWTPTISLSPSDSGLMAIHSCVKVEIVPVGGEEDLGNNGAKENIDYFEAIPDDTMINPELTSQANGFEPIIMKFRVGNPFLITEEIYVNIIEVTPGWELTCEGIGQFHELAPMELKEFKAILTPGPNVQFGETATAQMFIGYIRWDPWIDEQNQLFYQTHLVPIDGISFEATTMYRTQVDIDGDTTGSTIIVNGTLGSTDNPTTLFPQGEDNFILLEISSIDTNETSYHLTTMNSNGEFSYSVDVFNYGKYSIRAYYAGSGILTAAASSAISVETVVGSTTPPTTPPPTTSETTTISFIGFNLGIAIGTIITVAFIISNLRRRRFRS